MRYRYLRDFHAVFRYLPLRYWVPANAPLSYWSLRAEKQLWKPKQLLAIWTVLRTTAIVSKECKEVKMGNSLQ